jgi:hypothetical protein
MLYVIRNQATGKWVARFGSERSYTMKLEKAQTFNSRESAQVHCCGNEQVLSLDQVLGHPS